MPSLRQLSVILMAPSQLLCMSPCRVSVTREVLDFLECQAADATRHETGGIIAGSGSVDEGTVVVSRASDGGPAASSTLTSFSRDTRHCQALLDGWAGESTGRIDYLGEWHKHFENEPSPSRRDICTLASIARDQAYHVAAPILFIIGQSNSRSSLRVFLIDAEACCAATDWEVREE